MTEQNAPPESDVAASQTEERADKPGPAQTEDLDAKLAASDDRWRRAVADLDNYRKRAGREIDNARHSEREHVAALFLPVVDGLEQALPYVKPEDDGLRTGIEAVRAQAIEGLKRLGFPRIDQTGVPFDPQIHEVVTVVGNPGVPPQTVVQVVRPGYGMPGRILRPAGVVVTPSGA
ncbi:MAG: molecular chaperone GrpE [Propionibacteriaceae bacterium]|jgi:molecular chaperone GrpE|nr:nucleotide exchange factor GrpE [Propionibacteriaceae bacterium]MDX6321085.1 molecular chaperone GrpE [Propionibacteriaceae bacterium]